MSFRRFIAVGAVAAANIYFRRRKFQICYVIYFKGFFFNILDIFIE